MLLSCPLSPVSTEVKQLRYLDPGSDGAFYTDANEAVVASIVDFVAIECVDFPDETADTDGDGCSDLAEIGMNEALGGRRDLANPYDFYDVAGANLGPPDGYVDLFNDIVGVIDHYAPVGTEAEYGVNFDRGPFPIGADVWDLTAPDGKIDLFNDISGVINQFGHDCR